MIFLQGRLSSVLEVIVVIDHKINACLSSLKALPLTFFKMGAPANLNVYEPCHEKSGILPR